MRGSIACKDSEKSHKSLLLAHTWSTCRSPLVGHPTQKGQVEKGFQGNIGKLKGLVLAQNSQVNFPWPIEVPVNHKYDRTGGISRTHVVVAQSPTIASVNRAGEQQSLRMRLQQPFV